MPHWLPNIRDITALVIALVSGLVTLKQLWWGKEVTALHKQQLDTKDDVIKSKEAQVKMLEAGREDLTKSRDAQVAALNTHLEAKDEVIKVKDTRLAFLDHVISPQFLDYLERQKEQVEKYNASLKEELQHAKDELRQVTLTVNTMSLAYHQAKKDKDQLSGDLQALRERLELAESYSASMSSSLVSVPDFIFRSSDHFIISEAKYTDEGPLSRKWETAAEYLAAFRLLTEAMNKAYQEAHPQTEGESGPEKDEPD